MQARGCLKEVKNEEGTSKMEGHRKVMTEKKLSSDSSMFLSENTHGENLIYSANIVAKIYSR